MLLILIIIEKVQQVNTKHELINKNERNLCVKSCIIFYTDILINVRETNFTKYLYNITHIYILLSVT